MTIGKSSMKSYILASTALGLILTGASAYAPAAEAAILPDNQNGEVLVTARRRSESVQTVPVAISVVGGEQLDKTGVNMPVVGDLPLACAATCAASVRVQEMGMEAAARGDVALLKLAMLHDPLVGAVCAPEEVWQMTDELLVAQAPWLPQYRTAIPAARRRLEEAERNGTRVRLRNTPGAARRAPKTVEEMAHNVAEARENAGAADKGKMTH